MAEAKGKKSMVIYHDWMDIFEDLTAEEVGQLMLALLRFDISGEETKFTDKALRITFKQLKATIKRDREAYTEKCEKNRERIRNYWAQKNTNENERKRTYSNRTDNDSDNDIDIDNDSDSGSDSDSDNDIDVPLLGNVKDYFHNNNYKSDPVLFFQFNAARYWDRLKKGMTWQQLAERWEANEKPKKKGGDPGDIGFDW